MKLLEGTVPLDARFDWWDKKLRGENPPLAPEAVHCGYYRKKSGKGPDAHWQAVGIYPAADGSIVVRVDGRPTNQPPEMVFSFACRQPITFDQYYAVVIDGKPWPDSPPELTGNEPESPAKPAEIVPPLMNAAPQGTAFPVSDFAKEDVHKNPPQRVLNQPPDDVPAADRVVARTDNQPTAEEITPLAAHLSMLAEEKTLIEKWLGSTKITTQELANKASEWANRVSRLSKWLIDTHKAAKAPILEEGRRLDAAYLRPAEEATALAKRLTEAQTGFFVAEERRLQEETARRRREEAERAKAQEGAGGPQSVPATSEPSPAKPRSGGASGRATHLAKEMVAEVTDYRVLSATLISGGLEGTPANECRNPDLRFVLDTIANRMAKVALPDAQQPGFRVVEKARARR